MNTKFFRKSLFSICAILALHWLAACATLMGEDGRNPSSDNEIQNENCSGRFCDQKDDEDDDNGVKRLEMHGGGGSAQLEAPVQDAIAARDVILGMTRTQVLQSWGEPTAREVAGNGSGGHERWHYGTQYSLRGERVVIFENGVVAGWYR